MSRVNRRRLTPHPVTYLQADLFTWEPPQSYDVVFFSFWLSHIPPDRFADFWNVVERALRPSGRIFFIDSYQEERSEAADQRENLLSQRELNDGRQFEIIKVFYQLNTTGAVLHVYERLGGLKYGEIEVGQETVIFDSESSHHTGDEERAAQ